ncbi:MAG: UDP-N-acetylmuramate--L-alanine ligase [Clostridia bacterium]|nr:UDP-N-acetylmuramate--L-alanine ligase [Clostridia bacterium]
MPHIKDFKGKRAHMIGIGGSSMSGLAGMLVQAGVHVTGSDSARSYMTDSLAEQGIPVTIGHRAGNVSGADLIIYSAAIREDNPERAEAARLGIPQMERATLLGQLMEGYAHAINVCGTHGKTTTTSMIAEVLLDAGLDPTVHIGGQLDYIGGSTRVGSHETFVVEACEFNASFLQFHPTIAVVTNIEEDHLDFYKDLDDIAHAFDRFFALLPETGVCIGNGDDPRVLDALGRLSCRTVTYGLGQGCQWRPQNLTFDETGCAEFDFAFEGRVMAHVLLHVPGEFNVMHALATMAACVEVGADAHAVAQSLSRFTAPHRRFEYTGSVCGVKLYTDYGHNPAEMHSALQNAAHQPHRRLWAVMQPHTYSRVKTLFKDYIHCCDLADEILITDIFAAREKDPGDIHATMLVDAIAATGQSVHYTPTFNDAEAYLRAHWQSGDLVITMSCGDIHLLNAQIQKHGDENPFAASH